MTAQPRNFTFKPRTSASARGRLVGLATLALVFTIVVSSSPATAQSDSLFSGFQKYSEYVVEVDGDIDKKAEVYFQQRIPAYLIVAESLTSPALIMPRTQQVQSVSLMKMTKRGATMDLAADAVFATKGTFEREGTEITFSADGHTFVLKEKPVLRGLMRASGLENYSSNYITLADSYTPNGPAIEALKKDTRDVRVRVYFGSWCPFCSRYVPRIIRVGKELAGSNIKIDYYGLPKNFDEDKEVVDKMKLTGVPTAVVFIDGREAGRIKSDSWQTPELSLKKIADARK